jgi:hypothetical protein
VAIEWGSSRGMLPTMFPVHRRTVLLAPLAAVTGYLLVGCTDAATSPAPSDPEREALMNALNQEADLRQLASRWFEAGNTVVNPQTVAAVLTTHVDTLARTLRATASPVTSTPVVPSTAASPADAPPVTADTLATAAFRTARSHRRTLMTFSAPAAQLLASIAASDVALATSLRVVA